MNPIEIRILMFLVILTVIGILMEGLGE